MIKANELRIGNLVNNVYTVIGISDFDVTIQYKDDYASEVCQAFNEIIPIPLTDEWFLKLGFKKDDYGQYVRPEMFSGFQSNFNKPGYFLMAGDDKDEPKVEYVHQLQNLFFALTGKELEPISSSETNKSKAEQ